MRAWHRKLILLLALLAFGPGAPAAANAWDLPPLVLPDLQGRRHSLYDWHGKVILLNFWASWCGPCLTELPHLAEFQRRYGSRGLQVIGVGLDNPRKLANVARTLEIPYPVLHSPVEQATALLQQWGDRAGVLPYTVVIGRDGRLVFSRVGVFDEEAFAAIVAPLLEP
ncbi:hypothetical protein MIT9_P1372 [Methylomarinovum caldicuralii]|uniref:Thioredoxin domain-containing protein n=1 Tax=Methylomarinovum caldicuralii TaxID=438856 RepID=A0AAU9CQL2_9GAMM|nr:TlpA disulfide reductase family protein [Methylomarinovum caldicuralii]BCX81792.1 hypothetical protein MIT9_P1372 [Methylomarinovum caldicuralii]